MSTAGAARQPGAGNPLGRVYAVRERKVGRRSELKVMRNLVTACTVGFLFGSIFYGSGLSLLHLAYNQVASMRDAVLTLVAFVLLYGLWAAAAFAAGHAVAGGLGMLKAWAHRPAATESVPEALPRRSVLLGAFLFNLFFWELYFFYGLTYDEAAFGRLSGVGGMVVFAAVAALPIAGAVGLVSWWLTGLFERLHRRGWLAKAALACYLLAFLVHAAAALSFGEPAADSGSAALVDDAQVEVEETGLKVLFLGLDGADWRVLQPLLERGELPAFSALVQGGAAGELATLRGANSSGIWASIYTGMPPSRHGVQDFFRIQLAGFKSEGLFAVHRTYFMELAGVLEGMGLARKIVVNRSSLEALPIWEIVDRLNTSIGLIDAYYYSFPALKPSLDESFVIAYGADALATRLAAGNGVSESELDDFAQPPELLERLQPYLGRGDFYWQSAALLDLLEHRPQPKFLHLYTHEPDAAQHRYWKWYEPQYYLGVTEQDLRRFGGRITTLYRDFDSFLGRLPSLLDPDTVVVIASDHGHSPTIFHHRSYTDHRHGPPGVVLLFGGPVKQDQTLRGSHVLDIFPTLLYLLGIPVPEDAEGDVLLEALEEGFVRRHPVRTIPSYQGLWSSTGADSDNREEERNRQELEKLKALGYI